MDSKGTQPSPSRGEERQRPGRGIMAPSQRREVSEASPSLKWGPAWGDQEIPSPAWDEQPFPNPHRDRQQESEQSPGSLP